MVQILKGIYSDVELANYLGFKGGTALMFFYELPRFSVDLDFDLIDRDKASIVYEKLRKIILKYGNISDEAKKFYGLLFVLDYGKGERKLKIEISNRSFENHYEIKSLFGISMKVMTAPDMFAHKLCAVLDRKVKTNRDIFDIWFFMENQTHINKGIVESRMGIPLSKHISNCIDYLESLKGKHLLDGLGELMDSEIKQFVKTQLLKECIRHLKFYEKYPLLNS
jgi:predicted nucleotidyltransferase component of viral defense system